MNVKNYILIIYFLLIFSYKINGQNWARINEILYDADYYLFTAQFNKAAEKYVEALKFIPNNANILYKLGICYLNYEDDKTKAIEVLKKASENINTKYNPNNPKEEAAPPEVLFLLGSAYRSIEKLDEAIEYYNKFISYLTPKQKKEKALVEQYLKSCYNAKETIKNKVYVKYKNLGPLINNQYSNINASISGDGTTLAFTTETKEGNKIYISIKKDNEWTKPKEITSQLGNPGKSLKSVSLSNDGTTLILVEEDPLNSELYFSKFERGRWMPAKKFPFNSKYNETHACFTPDEKRIYFTSDRPGGKGDMDIYYIDIDNKGNFGKPINFEIINTPFNEETPFLTPDGKYLFFSSEGFNSIGGYDIFYIDLNADNKTPIRLEYPINTTDNDIFYYPLNDFSGMKSIFTPDGYGKKDIYLIEKVKLFNIEGTFVYENNITPQEVPIVSIINTEGKIINHEFPTDVNKLNFKCSLPEGEYNINVIVPGFQLFEKKLLISQNEKLEITLTPDIKREELVVKVADTINYNKVLPETFDKIDKKEIKKKEKIKDVYKQKEVEDKITHTLDNKYFYTIQFLALKKPKNPSTYKNLNNIFIDYNSIDKLYRYNSGIFYKIEDAEKYLVFVQTAGYKDAFIKKQFFSEYTIQFIAIKKDINWKLFKDFKEYTVFLKQDGFNRFVTGKYNDTKSAIEGWKNLSKAGYTNSFIRKYKTLLDE